jgi:hypothetical protein
METCQLKNKNHIIDFLNVYFVILRQRIGFPSYFLLPFINYQIIAYTTNYVRVISVLVAEEAEMLLKN